MSPIPGSRRAGFLLPVLFVAVLALSPPPLAPQEAPPVEAGAPPDDPPSHADEPRAGWQAGSFFLESADGRFRMAIGGRVQPRYQLRDPPVGESTSSFFLRRVRLDLQGHLFDPRLTFRVMPEMAQVANLRDGWLDYAFSPSLRIRAGQQPVPFHWHRFISETRQQFAERSLPSETFGFPTGFDVGVILHGRDAAGRLQYGVGVFDGAGRNVRESNSVGNMASGRLTWAIRGPLPREEPDLAHTESPEMSLGLGLQGATRNEVRAWDLGRSAAANPRADWATATVDASFRWAGFGAFGEVYARRVDPEAEDVEAYSGWAGTLGAGYFVVPARLEPVVRASRSRLDRNDPATRSSEWGLGINAYHHGHLWKTQLQYLQSRLPIGSDRILLLQTRLQF